MSRYRDRHSLAGAKSDPGDARLLADLVRTDRHNHRPVAGDTDQINGLKALARAHQNLIWDRTRHTNRLRNDLREYFPAALIAFETLAHKDAVAVLSRAPHPADAARLSTAQIRSVLKGGGRQRNLDTRAAEIQAALRTPQLAASPAVSTAFAATTRALVAVIAGLNTQIAALEAEIAPSFERHPDADIYLSLPGLGVTLGARVLAEFGDDPEWPAMSGTGGSMTLSINGRCARSTAVQGAGRSMTSDALPVIFTIRHYEHSGTGSSAISTAASKHAATTTSTPPGHTDNNKKSRSPLDNMRPWDV